MRAAPLFVASALLFLAACRTTPEKPDGDLGGLGDGDAEDADGDGVPAESDCDDGDAAVGPDAVEVCDGIDNNCDGQVDEGVTTAFYADRDADGFGDDTTEVFACAPDAGEVGVGGDCDDDDGDVFPGASEVCDGDDDNCDGVVDEGVTTVFFTDADGDGYGDAPVDACELGSGLSPNDLDCDDMDPAVNPDGVEICNELDDNCDGDVDEGVTTTFYRDADGDGYGDAGLPTEACTQPDGYAVFPGDCDDDAAAVSPDATELCNGLDDNCDGVVDEEDAGDAQTWYGDTDGDGYGDPASSTVGCAQPPDTSADNTDCDDGNPDINPGATEVCNTVDDDCDGASDDSDPSLDLSSASSWYEDDDGDGYGDAAASRTTCVAPAGHVSDSADCDDLAFAVNPAASEVCNGIDDDCDGLTDDADTSVDTTTGSTWYTDADGDGYGNVVSASEACDAPTGAVSNSSDCDDGNNAISPAATEVCNGVDDDCDGNADDADAGLDLSTATVHHRDADGDGYGDGATTDARCSPGGGYIVDDSDCDDSDAATYPGAFEACSAGADMDCDGVDPDTCMTCQAYLDDGMSVGDGLYTIDPDGPGGLSEVETWCDMTTDGGGWTLVQRTVWDWSDSSQLDTGYATWYGSTLGDPTGGFAFRLAGRYWSDLNLDQEHMLLHVPRDGTTGADCAELVYIGTGGAYTITSSSTSLSAITAPVTFANTTTLSTADSGPSSACVNNYDATPWFYTNCCTTCPTFDGTYWTDEAHPMASYIDGTPDEYGNVDADVCSSGAAVTSYGYEGVNVMEYYLR